MSLQLEELTKRDGLKAALREAEVRVRGADAVRVNGRVIQAVGLVIDGSARVSGLGEICRITTGRGRPEILAEVVGFREGRVLLMPLADMEGVGPESEIVPTGRPLEVAVGRGLLGRVLDGLGRPQDGLGPLRWEAKAAVHQAPPDALRRRRIREILPTGVRAIDGLMTVGRGQRMGIFAGSGVGKSVLLGMIARYTRADVNVIALVGERGREVRDFIERDLKGGLARSVVIAATSDQPALVRRQAAWVACAIAEYFRDLGFDVMFMMDSVTRFAQAQREIGLAVGEPPTTRGYTPSVFAHLPRLLERAGTSPKRGSVTGLYTVLVEADDMNEPIADAVRAILDGHVVLSRDLAAQNHYPSVDILQSVSRLMIDIAPKAQQDAAGKLRELLATYRDARDLVNIGAYVKGSNPRIDWALEHLERVNAYLKQDMNEHTTYEETARRLVELLPAAGAAVGGGKS
jgi:flagellum-specific ATP synthase